MEFVILTYYVFCDFGLVNKTQPCIQVTTFTSTRVEFFSALAMSFGSVVSFFIRLKPVNTDMSTSERGFTRRLEILTPGKITLSSSWRLLTSIIRLLYNLFQETVLVEVCISKPELHLLLHVSQQLFDPVPLLLLCLKFQLVAGCSGSTASTCLLVCVSHPKKQNPTHSYKTKILILKNLQK